VAVSDIFWVTTMDDLRQRFATLDRVPVPDLWDDVEHRSRSLAGSEATIDRRPVVWLFFAVVLLAILLVAGAVAVGSRFAGIEFTVQPSPDRSVVSSPSPSALPSGSGSWSATGNMVETRFGETATRLTNGRVLVAGGGTDWAGRGASSATAELYDPTSGRWTLTGSMHEGRQGHAAVLLVTGEVLVIGGQTSGAGPGAPHALATAELYDPDTGLWRETGLLATARVGATATFLQDGKVVAVGGATSAGPVRSAETYDPATGAWTKTGAMDVARQGHTATLLPDGRVLVAGGGCCDQAARALVEWYDPTSGTWTKTGSLATPRVYHSAVLLADGRVLVFGGDNRSDHAAVTDSEVYEPGTGLWVATGSPLSPGNVFEALGGAGGGQPARLLDGRVLAPAYAAAGELYDPAIGSWSQAGGLTGDLYDYVHTATLLTDGRVLVTYEPASALFDSNRTP
jgi:hypothetical protein